MMQTTRPNIDATDYQTWLKGRLRMEESWKPVTAPTLRREECKDSIAAAEGKPDSPAAFPGEDLTAEHFSKNRRIRDFFKGIAELGNVCSDIHIATGHIPMVRVNGELAEFIPSASCLRPLSEPEVKALCEFLLPTECFQEFLVSGQTDASCSCRYGLGEQMELRFRANMFRDQNGTSLALRIIKEEIPSMRDLRIPAAVQRLKDEPFGLVTICGPTGSGKSTTLASIIEAINEEQAKRIITIEDPIEYIHPWKKAVISQREIGRDCRSFRDGLRAALRQDPDIILLGEMRDAETIATALAAAETGHLVLTTLHTATTAEAIDRMVQYFPAEAQRQIRSEISSCFRGFVAQKLFKTKQDSRAAAFEVLLHTEATANLIRQGQIHQLKNYMSAEAGMIRMEDSIQGLRNLHLID